MTPRDAGARVGGGAVALDHGEAARAAHSRSTGRAWDRVVEVRVATSTATAAAWSATYGAACDAFGGVQARRRA